MALYFDYDVFFRYYSDPSNFYKDSISIKANFFRPSCGAYTRDSSWLSGSYFIVNHQEVYVTVLENELLFSILKYDAKKAALADHFHIGNCVLRNTARNMKNVDMILFHYSKQDLVKNVKDMTSKCNFRNRLEDLNDIAHILCTNMKDNMNNVLSTLLPHVEHILKKPFCVDLQLQTAGGKSLKCTKKCVDYDNQRFKVYRGKRNAEYIHHQGQMKSINRLKVLTLPNVSVSDTRLRTP